MRKTHSQAALGTFTAALWHVGDAKTEHGRQYRPETHNQKPTSN